MPANNGFGFPEWGGVTASLAAATGLGGRVVGSSAKFTAAGLGAGKGSGAGGGSGEGVGVTEIDGNGTGATCTLSGSGTGGCRGGSSSGTSSFRGSLADVGLGRLSSIFVSTEHRKGAGGRK